MRILAYIFIFSLFFAGSCKKNISRPMSPQTTKTIKYLALGDSYTIGEGVPETDRFPVVLSEELKKNNIIVSHEIIATTGWTTADLKKGIMNAGIRDNKYDMVSLLIGVNNQYQGKSLEEYKMEFKELLLMSIELAQGNTKNVFVISIPDYGYTPFGASSQARVSADIDIFNAANKRIATTLGVNYFDITVISRQGLSDPGLITSDGLHPSGKMYERWVALMLDDIIRGISGK
jgi:lysophospholipase L1-like esterase